VPHYRIKKSDLLDALELVEPVERHAPGPLREAFQNGGRTR
jgi:hypothetical protein